MEEQRINALLENAIEITWIWEALCMQRKVKRPEDSRNTIASIQKIAKDFEKKFSFGTSWNGDLDYIEEIEKFAEEKLVKEYGIEV